ncbi:hypothetical protein CANCADRAFT_95448 [Tortispora caseinolytica NRRL Y-17796]|uniref:DNA-directed RNA polymerase subunit n=1 Tax=Tortispora caseinolytica NRRL Y-17796 TaxID=767744 RepID=A0A1E4TMG5_9ASCO|nr:hypothetical protein CANCADRAFT_95448 [Tortispora caseinolytica NRRL Y-17796]
MLTFCPRCMNSCCVAESESGVQFACLTCPYRCPIGPRTVISERKMLKSKEVDDILGGASAWDNVDQTSAHCDACDNNKAYFFQLQIRSADEPMTTFLRCTNCGKQWKEN